MKTIFCLLVFFLFFNCKKADSDKGENSLEIYYLGPGVSTPYDYSCGMISKQFLKDDINYKRITDKKIIAPFMKMYENYKGSQDSNAMNIRIKVLIHSINKTDTLCMGEHFNTYLNGVKMIDNKKLLNYVKKNIDYDSTVPSYVRKHPERYKTK
jgi:hypothetical protein